MSENPERFQREITVITAITIIQINRTVAFEIQIRGIYPAAPETDPSPKFLFFTLMIISAMVVVANNDVIGKDNDILWEIPKNWAY
jgi:hypothetical protein